MKSYQEDNKRVVKNTIYLYLRMIVTTLIGLYSSRLILENLGVVNYGVYNIVAGVVSMFSMFSSFFTSTCQRFLTYSLGSKDEEKIRATFSNIHFIVFFVAILSIVITLPFSKLFVEKLLEIPKDRIDASYLVFFCSIITFAASILSLPFNALVIACEKMSFFAIITIINTFLKLVIILILPYFRIDSLILYSVLLLIVTLLNNTCYFLYCCKTTNYVSLHFKVRIPELKPFLSMSFWVGLGTMFGILKDHGGNVVLNNYYGVTLNSARGFAAQAQGVISMLSTNIGMAISPQITKSYASGDFNRATYLTYLLVKVQGCLILFLSLPVMVEAPFLLKVWLKNPPAYTDDFLRYSLILSFVHLVSSAYGTLYLAIGRVKKLQIYTSVCHALYIPVCIIIYSMGASPSGFLIVGIILECLTTVICYRELSRLIEFSQKKLYLGIVAPMIFLSVVSLLLGLSLSMVVEESFSRFLLNSLIVSGSFVTLIYFFMLSATEKNYFKELLFSKIRLIKSYGIRNVI